MNRRGFLGSLLATATLDPERLLWVPGKKHISIPKPVDPFGLMPPEPWADWIAGETLRVFQSSLTPPFYAEFRREFIGDSVRVKMTQRLSLNEYKPR